jgi:methylated-DNA-[protein]-cysteine S-methyltransferase
MLFLREMELRNKINNFLKKLPKGKITTYKFVAEKFNSHPRAIARILSTNKDKSVPCYKVIYSNGKIGGYNGLLKKSKEELIKRELKK